MNTHQIIRNSAIAVGTLALLGLSLFFMKNGFIFNKTVAMNLGVVAISLVNIFIYSKKIKASSQAELLDK